MATRTLSDLDVAGRRVFMRVDFDVPLTPAGGLADAAALREALPTLQRILDQGARVVLAAHLGNPGGTPTPSTSLLPIGAFLAEALSREVLLTDEPVGDGARKVISDLREGQIALLENLRWSPGEEANDETFARALASYGDVYINDAFSTAHLRHASVAGAPKHVSQRAGGPRLCEDLAFLKRFTGEVERPFVAVVGGTRVEEKLSFIQSHLGRVDGFVLGGAVANTFLRARGADVGRSPYDEDKLPVVRDILNKAHHRDVEVWLPTDVVAGVGPRGQFPETIPVGKIAEDRSILDSGPTSAAAFANVLQKAKTILWNGPMGAYESDAYAAGTVAVGKAIAVATGRGALSLVCGGHAAAMVRRAGVEGQVGHVTNAGAAALEFLEGRKLPGLAVLEATT